MSDEKLFTQLEPPPGGWLRLQTRRSVSHAPLLGVPFAAAAALALVMVLLRPQAQHLQLPWTASRLVAQPSEGSGLHDVVRAQATALPSDDPGVQFYWLQGREAPELSTP